MRPGFNLAGYQNLEGTRKILVLSEIEVSTVKGRTVICSPESPRSEKIRECFLEEESLEMT